MVALSLAFVFGMMSLTVDLGWSYFRRCAAQTAADAAAQSAASWAQLNGYTCGSSGVACGSTYTCAASETSPPADELKAGCLYAAQNGFTTGGNSGRQTVSMIAGTGTPTGSTGISTTLWVKAVVEETSPTFLGRFAGMSSTTVRASATSGVTVSPSGACVYSLHPSASGAVSAKGTVSVTASCGIYVNSNSTSAFVMTGNSNVAASQILVNGSSSIASNSVVSPAPTANAGSVSDPLSGLPMPSVSGCTYYNWSATSHGTLTLNPGVYCGGISVSAQATLNFNPGTYILNGGGMSITGGATLNGTGVTFFNTAQSGYTAGPIGLAGNTTFNLASPTTGTYQGILFVQDPSITYSGSNQIAGTSGSTMSGTLYFPTTNVNYTGTSTSSGSYTAIVASTVSFTGTTYFKNDTTGQYTGLASKSASLIP